MEQGRIWQRIVRRAPVSGKGIVLWDQHRVSRRASLDEIQQIFQCYAITLVHIILTLIFHLHGREEMGDTRTRYASLRVAN